MTQSSAAHDRVSSEGRSPFEGFVEWVHRRASEAPFFFVCLAVVLAWLISLPLWADLKSWQVAIHTVTSVMTLLLLVLLENASRRADETSQEKLNVLAEAVAALMDSRAREDPDLRDSAQHLRQSVGLERRH